MNLSTNYNGNLWINVFSCIGVIAVVYAILLYIGFLYHASQFFSLSFSEMLMYKNTFESKMVFTLFSMIQLGSLLLIGYYVGGKAYRFRWIYGGIVGMIWMIAFLLSTVLFTLFTVEQFMTEYRPLNPAVLQAQYKELSLVFAHLPTMFLKTAGITALGGAASGFLANINFNKK